MSVYDNTVSPAHIDNSDQLIVTIKHPKWPESLAIYENKRFHCEMPSFIPEVYLIKLFLQATIPLNFSFNLSEPFQTVRMLNRKARISELIACKIVVLICSLSALILSCSRAITSRSLPFEPIIPTLATHEWNIHGSKEPLKILYLGCGHLVLQYNKECIVIDPFFSTQGIMRRRIHSDTTAFEKYKSILEQHQVTLSGTNSIWIAHTHYDHMMDVPLMLEKQMISKEVTIYGNEFGDDILTNFVDTNQYHALAPAETYNPNKAAVVPSWLMASPSIRVMPILSDHAPHYKIGPIRFHLMRGPLRKNYFSDHFKKAADPTKRNQWKEGYTYSFLVDIMKGDEIAFRLFIQTSSSDYPLGRPPLEVLAKRHVDVAFLCAASANFVKPYPVQILQDVKPAKVVFIHWEDFFRKPLDFDGARLVRATNFRKLNRTLIQHNLKPSTANYLMPRPGTMITIK
jgi:hypothetical protein